MKLTKLIRGVVAGAVLMAGAAAFANGSGITVTTETVTETEITTIPVPEVTPSEQIDLTPGAMTTRVETEVVEETYTPVAPAPITTVEPYAARAEFVETEEIEYYDRKFATGTRYIFYNFRDGVIGLVDNTCDLVTGVAAGVGIVAGKTTVLAGDVVGFVDDSLFTRWMFRGIVSDLIEEKSFQIFRCVRAMMYATHDFDDLPIVVEKSEYIDDDLVFKTRLYLRPWAIIVLPATIVGDGIIRPAGNICKMFSIRGFADMEVADIPTQLEQFGLGMVEGAYHEQFFFPIPEEEEPDLRIYTEEEAFGLEPPGPMLRPTPERVGDY